MAPHAAVTEQHLEAMREHYGREIENARAAGLLREERYIHSPQAAEIDVEYPAGSAPCRVINMCSNNYLGLSSHPEVIAAAHQGLGR